MNRTLEDMTRLAFACLQRFPLEIKERCINMSLAAVSNNNAINRGANLARQSRYGGLDAEALKKGVRWLFAIRATYGEQAFESAVQLVTLPSDYIPGNYPVGWYLGRLGNDIPVFDREVSHLHHGVTRELLARAFAAITDETERISKEHDFGKFIGQSTCVPTTDADEIVFAQRVNRDGLTRFVKNRLPRQVTTMVLILRKSEMGTFYVLTTAYIGSFIGPEPWSPIATPEHKANWQTHALIWGSEQIIPGTETTDVPWYFL